METQELNIEEASTSLAADILGKDSPADDLDATLDTAIDGAGDEKDATEAAEKPAAPSKANGKDAPADATAGAVEALPMPKSWAKDQQETWDEMTPRGRAQYVHREKQMLDGLEGYKGDAEYGRSLRGVLSKHDDILRSQGLQAPQAVEYLFNAHRNLSQGTQEQKMAYAERLFKTYGLTMPQAQAAAVDAEGNPLPVAQTPPEVKAAIERMERIEAAINQEQTHRFESARLQASADVEAFAADTEKHPHFDECAAEIAGFIKGGEKLDAAYEKAVWANPVTRQKEIARIQQASEKANAEKVAVAAKAAKKTTSTNVKGRDTTRTPTGRGATVANMDEVLRETYDEIKSRA